MKVHAFIATTQGPIAVQNLVAEEPDVQSVICVDGGIEPLPISGRYHDFVRKGTGLIQRDFGQPAYRMDVSGRIDQGNSWQLPAYLAHYLYSEGLLGDGNPQPGDKVIWATGALKADKSIIAVEEVFNKLTNSQSLFENLWRQDIPILVVVPSADEVALQRWQSELEDAILIGGLYSNLAPDNLTLAMQDLSSYIKQGEASTEVSMPPFGVAAISESTSEAIEEIKPTEESEQSPHPQIKGKKNKPLTIAVLASLLVGLVIAGAYMAQPTAFPEESKVSMVVELGDFPGDCNQNFIIERVLSPSQGHFPSVSLNRLCAIWLETSPSVKAVVGMALDNGAILPIQYQVDKWRISLPQKKSRSREYALLALNIEYLDPVRDSLALHLKNINARQNGISIESLQKFIEQEQIEGSIYQHQLIYSKMSHF